MPDRLTVANNPYVGMVFLFNRRLENWIIEVLDITPASEVRYRYSYGASSIEDIEEEEYSWRTSWIYQPGEWTILVCGESEDDEYAPTKIEILNGITRTPDWEV